MVRKYRKMGIGIWKVAKEKSLLHHLGFGLLLVYANVSMFKDTLEFGF